MFCSQQCKLFHSIKPLFVNKPTLLVLNKIDVTRLDDLPQETRALVDEIIDAEDVMTVHVSCYSDEGVNEVKTAACDKLLAHRVESKLKGTKINSVLNRIHVAVPKARDDATREPFIPDAVKTRRKYDPEDPMRRRLERDIEAEEGGAGVYNMSMKSMFSILILRYFCLLTRMVFFLQRTTCWQTKIGRMTLFPRSWMAKTLPISSTRISMPS